VIDGLPVQRGLAAAADILSRRAWPIRVHLALFAVALLAPILLFSLLLARYQVATERRANEQRLSAMVHSVAADTDREIAGAISILKALANSPSLKTSDLAAFYTQAKSTLAASNRNAVLMDLSGRQVVNTRVAWGEPLPTTERRESQFPLIIARTRAPHVSDLFVGTVSRQLLISVSVPVFKDDQVAYALVMSFDPAQLVPVLEQAQMPAGWRAGISDRNDRVIARSSSHQMFVGKQLSKDALQSAGQREGFIETTDLEGNMSLQAFYWSTLSGWRFAVWAPRGVIEAPLRVFQALLALLGTGALVLAALLALFFGRRLSAPIAAAAEEGRRLGQGKALRPLASPLSEANELVDALRGASVEIRQRTRDLRNSETRLRMAQNLAGLATAEWNLKTGQVVCSDNFSALFGLPEGAPVDPSSILAVVDPEDRERLRADIDRVKTEGGAYDSEFRIRDAEGQVRWLAGSGEAITDLDGTPSRIIGASYDVTDLKKTAEMNAQLAAVVQFSLDAVMSLTPDGVIQTWNSGAEALFGYRADEIVGQSARILYRREDQAGFDEQYAKFRRGEELRNDGVRVRKDGKQVQVAVNVAPMYSSGGRLSGFSAIVRDISDRKQYEEHLRFVMRELSHRSKNLLAVIQAMARQTARSSADLEEFEKNYSQRLQALSASHDLLVHQNWHGAPLAELLQLILAPFVDDVGERIELDGPKLFVSPTAAQNLALSFHELATNASKYGALSVPKGQVHIHWHVELQDNGEDRLRITWKESGGPPVSPPRRQGFGHTVIKRMIAQALESKVELDFHREGVLWSLDMPTTFLVA
jgi:PAS domain S-box-containing protein